MLHENTQIHWMDINSMNVQNNEISNIFKEYAHMIEKVLSSDDMTIYQINFIDTINDEQIKNIKISDVYGWTNIICIRKIILTKPIKWYKITAANRELIVSENSFIPIYDNKSFHRGFHGVMLYNYVLKNPSKIKHNDNIRIHRGIDENQQKEIEFPIANVEEFKSDENFGYEIITKSRFGNANHISIHMYDSISIEEAKFIAGLNFR